MAIVSFLETAMNNTELQFHGQEIHIGFSRLEIHISLSQQVPKKMVSIPAEMKYFSSYNYLSIALDYKNVHFDMYHFNFYPSPHCFLDGKRMQESNRHHDVDQTNGTQPLKGLICNIAY